MSYYTVPVAQCTDSNGIGTTLFHNTVGKEAKRFFTQCTRSLVQPRGTYPSTPRRPAVLSAPSESLAFSTALLLEEEKIDAQLPQGLGAWVGWALGFAVGMVVGQAEGN